MISPIDIGPESSADHQDEPRHAEGEIRAQHRHEHEQSAPATPARLAHGNTAPPSRFSASTPRISVS
jgi:hypothetical protein